MVANAPRMILFGPGTGAEADAENFGNKAAILAKMARMGIPVPPGFSLSVSICEEYFKNDRKIPPDLPELLKSGIRYIENMTGRTFGSERKPLLVSVRSGAPVTMPGVMDTVLNVGLNRETIRGLIYFSGNPRFAWDTYRRFLEQFGRIVLGNDPVMYHSVLKRHLEREGVEDEGMLDFSTFREIAMEYERLHSRRNGKRTFYSVDEQLLLASEAVLRSWMNPRAEKFRNLNLIEGAKGTAVTVQAMVYGNLGPNSGAGVAFSRNPWSGEAGILVDFKFGSQGEDVVSGERVVSTQEDLQRRLPDQFRTLENISKTLEKEFRDMQDMEFTVQEGEIYLLQSRAGKRTPLAALRIAVDMESEGIISKEEALERLKEIDLDRICIQRVRGSEPPLTQGTPASAGIAIGRIALTVEQALIFSTRDPVVLVRFFASPDDIQGIKVSEGLLTARGARTSHVAVVARQMGKVCIVKCTDLKIDMGRHSCSFRGSTLYEGDYITLDGATGAIYSGMVAVARERPSSLLDIVNSWKK